MRFLFEITSILKEHYSSINEPELMNKIFPTIKIDNINIMKFDLARLSLALPFKWHQLFGIDLLYQLFRDEDTIQLIGKKRNFLPKDFYNLTNDH